MPRPRPRAAATAPRRAAAVRRTTCPRAGPRHRGPTRRQRRRRAQASGRRQRRRRRRPAGAPRRDAAPAARCARSPTCSPPRRPPRSRVRTAASGRSPKRTCVRSRPLFADASSEYPVRGIRGAATPLHGISTWHPAAGPRLVSTESPRRSRGGARRVSTKYPRPSRGVAATRPRGRRSPHTEPSRRHARECPASASPPAATATTSRSPATARGVGSARRSARPSPHWPKRLPLSFSGVATTPLSSESSSACVADATRERLLLSQCVGAATATMNATRGYAVTSCGCVRCGGALTQWPSRSDVAATTCALRHRIGECFVGGRVLSCLYSRTGLLRLSLKKQSSAEPPSQGSSEFSAHCEDLSE